MVFRHGAWMVVFGAVALANGACKSDGESGGGGTGTTSTSTSTNAPVILPPTTNGQSCQQGGGSCDDQAAIDAYADCIVTTCDAEYKQCFGADYATGTVGGACAELLTCAMDCQDCDQACLTDCSNNHFVTACKDCILGPIASCAVQAIASGKCVLPCGPSTSTGGACDELGACCAALTGADQTSCNTTYGQVKLGGDAACGSVLTGYKSTGVCK